MTAHQPASSGPTGLDERLGGLARADVDLDTIEANVRALRNVSRAPLFAAVVKGNGYGHGAVEASRAALRGGANWLAVYTVDEGIVLRRAGIAARILVFGPFTAAQAARMVAFRLTPTITSIEAAEHIQDAAGGERVAVHIKFDTGLTRAGIAAEDAPSTITRLLTLPALDIEGVYTHFATAEEADKTAAYAQLARFHRAVATIREAGVSPSILHAANTAALLSIPDSHLDMVRAGFGLYGSVPIEGSHSSPPLRSALSLSAPVVRIHTIPPGTGVGYGHTFRAPRVTRIALVPLGYGDGLPRVLGGGHGQALIRGQRVPIVGRISMDQVTLDVTAVPGVTSGDQAVFIGTDGGETIEADDVAERADTNGYEILCGLMPRVTRIYRRGGRPVATMAFSDGPFPRPLESEAGSTP